MSRQAAAFAISLGIIATLSLAALRALPAPHAVPAPPAIEAAQRPPKARLFPPLDLGLLEGPDREQWQKPDLIMDALGVAEGSQVAEIGAAGGWFTVRLARRVGPNGRVYAEDIQPQMVDAIASRVQRDNLLNVVTILGRPDDPRLPAPIDAALMVETFHELEDPVALLKNVARALKPQGRVGNVDFNPGAGGPGPAPNERVDPESVIQAAAAAGLRLTKREEVPPFQFLLVFEKDEGR